MRAVVAATEHPSKRPTTASRLSRFDRVLSFELELHLSGCSKTGESRPFPPEALFLFDDHVKRLEVK